MSIRSLNARLERLQARAGVRHVIGQDRNRDRKRREQLRRLKLSPGLTAAQTAELAELDAAFEQEDRDHRRRWELWDKDKFGADRLTDAERIEYAELRERYPPNPNPPFGDLADRLRAVAGDTAADGTGKKFESKRDRAPAEVEECVTSEADRGAATGRPAPNAAAKLKRASPDSMTDAELMPDEHNAEKARSEFGLAELMGRIGNLYTKRGLSPPFILRDAVMSWGGLCQEEIVAIIEKHFQDCRQFYIAGAGDQHFHMVQSAISKALAAKYPRHRLDEKPERTRRQRAGKIR